MLNENAKKWVEELRSGEYQQGRNALKRYSSFTRSYVFCCLGVACELFRQENPGLLHVRGLVTPDYFEGESTWQNYHINLPPVVREWLGLSDSLGTFQATRETIGPNSLAEQNDNGASFLDIADLIEQEPRGLFR